MVLADGIESANIVGYQDIKSENAEEGFNVICPVFTTVGYNTVTLKDISLKGDNVKVRTDNLQIFDANGDAAYLYQWRADGWYDPEEGEYVNETVIDRGQGVVVDSYNGEITIRSVGEVCTGTLQVQDCEEGFNVVGNPFPVDITLENIALSGDNVKVRTDNLQIFDANGDAAYLYQWRNDGWYDPEEGEYVNETPFPAGLGVIVDSYNGGITIEVTAPSSSAKI